MLRYINAIALSRTPIWQQHHLLRVFTWEEGKAVCILKTRKIPLPEPPGLYLMEADFSKEGLFLCRDYQLLSSFHQPHHLLMHQLCLPLLEYFPLAEPSPFVFGRYLSALRRSHDRDSAMENTLWFLASVLAKEGLLPPYQEVKSLIRTRRCRNPKRVWRRIKEAMALVEGKD